MTKTLPVQCPNCGDPAVEVPLDRLESLHSGVTVDCSECGDAMVFDVMSTDEYARLHQAQELLAKAIQLLAEASAISKIERLGDMIAMREIAEMPGIARPIIRASRNINTKENNHEHTRSNEKNH